MRLVPIEILQGLLVHLNAAPPFPPNPPPPFEPPEGRLEDPLLLLSASATAEASFVSKIVL